MLKRTQDAHKWKAPSMATTSHSAENEVTPAVAFPLPQLISCAHLLMQAHSQNAIYRPLGSPLQAL